MITRFEVDGFKSLRNFAVDLEPLTVFVGPNGAGKSNLLEAMALLGRLTSMPMEEAFKKGRGRILDQFSRHGGETSRSIRFVAEVSLKETITDFQGNPLPTRYRYELVIERRVRDSGIEELAVADERLHVKDDSSMASADTMLLAQGRVYKRTRQVAILDGLGEDSDSIWYTPTTYTSLAAMAESIIERRFDVSKVTDSQMKALKNKAGFRTLKGAYIHVVLAGVRAMEDERGIDSTAPRPREGWQCVIDDIIGNLSQFRLIHLDAGRLREPTEKISSGILAADASNLAAVLADLPAPVLGSIRADLVSLIPGLSGFDIVAEGDSLRIDFKLSGGEVLPARLASDGTLRALALLAVLTVEPHPSILAIEEPENGIFPGRLRRLLSILRDLSVEEGRSQVLLTTHSPVVVAAFREKPELLRMVDIVVRDGKRDTRARPVGKPKKQSESALIASLREVDTLLHTADAEVAE